MKCTITPDQPITRRQRAHFVTDQDGHVLFSAPTLAEVFKWLAEREGYEFKIETPEWQAYCDLLPF